MSKHPSTMLTGHYTPRYKTKGAIMVVFEKGNRILIDYVGPGFDVGDITRGKTMHTAISVSWDNIYEKTIHNYKYARFMKDDLFQITDEQYEVSRENRIRELTQNLKEKDVKKIAHAIPKKTPKMSYKLFEQLYSECIDKVIYSGIQIPNKPFGIMMNIYGDKFCVFEVWNIERSLTKDIELDR